MNLVLITVNTTILILSTAIFTSGFQTQCILPDIIFEIDFLAMILADDEKTQSFVFFKYLDKDIVQISFELTEPQAAKPLTSIY